MCVACPSWARRPVDVGGGAGQRRGRLALVTAGEACAAFAALPYTAFSIYTNVLVNVANLMPMGDTVRLGAEGALAAAHAGGDFAQIIRCFVIWCSILYFVDMLLRKWNAPARQAEVEQGGLPTLWQFAFAPPILALLTLQLLGARLLPPAVFALAFYYFQAAQGVVLIRSRRRVADAVYVASWSVAASPDASLSLP